MGNQRHELGKIYFLQDLKDTNFDQKLLLPATISVKKVWSKWFLMFLMIMILCVSEPSFACISPIEKASFTTVERWVSTLFTLYLLWVLHFPIFSFFHLQAWKIIGQCLLENPHIFNHLNLFKVCTPKLN